MAGERAFTRAGEADCPGCGWHVSACECSGLRQHRPTYTYRCEAGHEQRSTQKVEKQQCQTCLRFAFWEPCR